MVEDEQSDRNGETRVPDFEMSALLTETQRKYLAGDTDIEDKSAQERALRGRIRNRLYQSVVDLGFLRQHLEHRDLAKAFEDPGGVLISASIRDNVGPAIALLFEGAIENQNGDIGHVGQTAETVEDLVEEALRRMYLSRRWSVSTVEVAIDIHVGDSLDDIADRDLETLGTEELRQLALTGRISFEQYEQILMNR